MGEISGTVTLTGSPVSGATVYVVDTQTNSVVGTTTTDVNGDYAVSGLPGGVERYHALVEYDDGQKYNAESLPFLSTPATLSPVATDVEFQTPTASVTNVSDIPDSAISRYTHDDADTSGSTSVDVWNGNDGTINGATTGVSGANQTYTTNEAYSFDGMDDYVDLPNLGLGSTSSFSIAAWINTNVDGSSVNQRIFGRFDGTNIIYLGNSSSITSSPDGGSSRGIEFRIGHTTDDADELRIYGSDLTDGTWHHVVATWDAGSNEGEIHEDGSLAVSGTESIQDFSTATGPAIGRRNGDNLEYFNGSIDDVRVYDKALTSTEVSNLYNTGSISG